MKSMHITQEEKENALKWAEDSSWVKQEIYNEDLEYMECVKDILDHPIFQSMDNFMQHGDTTCKNHCIKVSYMSYSVCRRLGWDYREVARAGLLHDLFLYDWHTHARDTGERFHGFTHPRTAMNNAVKYFELTENEKDMILRHMWPLTPIPPKSRGGLVIVYSDKFCGLVETVARFKRWFLFSVGFKSTA
jgi:uncharacterized protein